MANQKLPKHIKTMVEKNNMVLAIKELADEWQISMGDAKAHLDDYEAMLIKKREKKIAAIAKKQKLDTKPDKTDISNEKHNSTFDTINITETTDTTHQKNITTSILSSRHHQSTSTTSDSAKKLTNGLNKHLDDIGYKKPLLPYWLKRLLIIIIVMAILFFGLYQLID